MKRYRIIFALGIWVIVIPFLGVPLLAKKALLIIGGVLLLLLGVIMSQEHSSSDEPSNTGLSYAEKEPENKQGFYQEPETHIFESEDMTSVDDQ